MLDDLNLILRNVKPNVTSYARNSRGHSVQKIKAASFDQPSRQVYCTVVFIFIRWSLSQAKAHIWASVLKQSRWMMSGTIFVIWMECCFVCLGKQVGKFGNSQHVCFDADRSVWNSLPLHHRWRWVILCSRCKRHDKAFVPWTEVMMVQLLSPGRWVKPVSSFFLADRMGKEGD